MNVNQDREERARVLLKDAFDGVEAELLKCQLGQAAVDSEETLRWMASRLEEMLAVLDQAGADRPETPGLWYPVIDRWPLGCALRHKILV
jgi:hypothetical protein